MRDRSFEDAALTTSAQEIDTRLDPRGFRGGLGLGGSGGWMYENTASDLAPLGARESRASLFRTA